MGPFISLLIRKTGIGLLLLLLTLTSEAQQIVPNIGGPYFLDPFSPAPYVSSADHYCKTGTARYYSTECSANITYTSESRAVCRSSCPPGLESWNAHDVCYPYCDWVILGFYLCPPLSTGTDEVATTCQCLNGFVASAGACVAPSDLTNSAVIDVGKSTGCPRDPGVLFGNPCNAANGSKIQPLNLIPPIGISSDGFYIKYNSQTSTNQAYMQSSSRFGTGWASIFGMKISNPLPDVIRATRQDGKLLTFRKVGQNLVPDVDVNDRLIAVLDGGGTTTGWIFYATAEERIERYSAAGRIYQIQKISGGRTDILYSDASTAPAIAPHSGLPISLVSQYGRTISISFDEIDRINKMVNSDGQEYNFNYEGGNLTSITFPDGGTNVFIYGEPENTSNFTLPYHLTGIIDEASARYATFQYDSNGLAVATKHAGDVDSYQISYSGSGHDTTAIVTSPLGTSNTYGFTIKQGVRRSVSTSMPFNGGQANAATSRDDNGNVTSYDDFNNHRTCYDYNLARNLETTRVEGLANTATCSTLLSAGATLPTGSRKVSTIWHPDWSLPVQRAEPLKRTTWVYNNQPDPTNGNAVASCAPSSALLPDGKPIVVLCKTVEQATTDVDGHLGLSATLNSSTTSRVNSATYNQYGQVLTRTDANGYVTTYTYFSDTSFTGTDPNAVGHTVGDLQSVSNALGHLTQYTLYDKAGRLLSETSPNGVVTTYSYWPRGWLKTVSRGGELTTYDYWPTGLLKKVKLPQRRTLNYAYDDAHRLTDISDALGNTVHYTLDNAGNRINQTVKDSSGTLKRNIDRAYDALNRLQSVTGALQ